MPHPAAPRELEFFLRGTSLNFTVPLECSPTPLPPSPPPISIDLCECRTQPPAAAPAALACPCLGGLHSLQIGHHVGHSGFRPSPRRVT